MKFERIIPVNQFDLFVNEMKQAALSSKTGQAHILIEPPAKHRTTGLGSQGNHLNGHIQQICEYTGNDFEDVKKYVKQMAIPMGYPILQKHGHPAYDLWGKPLGISEKDCDTKQCGMLIDCVHRLAAELGILLRENENENWYY